MGNLIGITLNLQIALGGVANFIILILPIQEHGLSFFPLLSSCSVSFMNALSFSACKSLTSLGLFASFLFFVFFFFNSPTFHHLYKEMWQIYVYVVTCYPEIISSNSFCMETLGFSIHSTMSSAYDDNYTSSLPIWIHFLPFFLSDCCG